MEINFDKASFKDFENMAGKDAYQAAYLFFRYMQYKQSKGQMNYRLLSTSHSGPTMEMDLPGIEHKSFISLVANDYLNFSQHPAVKAAAISAIEKFGVGAGASPAIGGHFWYHEALEKAIATFFKRESAVTYTTGYTANSAALQAIMKKDDLAILDSGVHASVIEGCLQTNMKTFPHNNLEALERILSVTAGQYRSRWVIIDGVYSQDGDLAPLSEIVRLVKSYGAYLVMDDAHGTGVIGATGRGVIELDGLYDQVDIITGTFSKTFGHIGGYIVASEEMTHFLKYQSRQHIFSSTASPASACILKSIELIDTEPVWMERLQRNIIHLKSGLLSLGLDIGPTASAIIPVKIGDMNLNAEICNLLLAEGIYTNQINYPAVSVNNARIRMSVMATHEPHHLDRVLNVWEWIIKKKALKQRLH
jgi:glycine C-acetyltransferase